MVDPSEELVPHITIRVAPDIGSGISGQAPGTRQRVSQNLCAVGISARHRRKRCSRWNDTAERDITIGLDLNFDVFDLDEKRILVLISCLEDSVRGEDESPSSVRLESKS